MTRGDRIAGHLRRGTPEHAEAIELIRKGRQKVRGGSSGGAQSSKNDDAAVVLERAGLRGFEREVRFTLKRQWRLDFFWRHERVGLEVEGLNRWAEHPGQHRSVEGFTDNCVKYSEAAIEGVLLVRCTTAHVEDGTMVDLVRRALEARGGDFPDPRSRSLARGTRRSG